MTDFSSARSSGAERPERSCPMCTAWAASRSIGWQGAFRWSRCARCATRFATRRPTSEELAELYGEYYSEENLRVPEFVEKRLTEIIAPFRRYRQNGRLLDVGFGQGALLRAAAADGWRCAGTEIAPAAIQVARENGWEVWAGDFCEVDIAAAAFDVVCMTELLEHVERPAAYIEQAVRSLRPGGLLYVTLPSGAGLSSRLLGTAWSTYSAPEHLQLVSPGALRAALERCGFVRCRIRTEAINPSEIRHRLFRRRPEERFDRVGSGYAINQCLESASSLRLVKRAANEILNVCRLGDAIKAFAEKP